MEPEPRRLDEGGLINRDRTLRFLFNGKRYRGHPGDTLASALLAGGVDVVGRSLKFHRPRGIMTIGGDDPNAMLRVGVGPRVDPSLKATEVELYDGLVARSINGWPTLGLDLFAGLGVLGGVLAAGFPYKTFKPSLTLWRRWFEPLLRLAAGWGEAPEQADRDRYEHRHAHCDLLVVGAGPAGLAAALAAGRRGERVILADQRIRLGGSLMHTAAMIDGLPALDWVARAEAELRTLPEVRILPRTTVLGFHDHGLFTANERYTDHLGPRPGSLEARQRLWHIRARRVVLATGAIERPLVFPGNDRPGVMLADAVVAYIRRFAVLPGRRAAVFATHDGAYEAALALHAAGGAVAAVVDPRPAPAGPLVDAVRAAGIEVLAGSVITGTRATWGGRRLRAVCVRALTGDGMAVSGPARQVKADLLAMSGGWDPALSLWRQAGGGVRWDAQAASWRPTAPGQALACVAGGAGGTQTIAQALAEGFAAGGGTAADAPPVTETAPGGPPMALFRVPVESGWWRPAFVDFQADATAADIALAVREGFAHPELLKRYAVIGLGTDQGRMVSTNALGLLAEACGQPLENLAPTTARAPAFPVALGTLAGRAVGEWAAVRRLSPIHDWHAASGAVFQEDGGRHLGNQDGGWLRPRCHPLPGETAHHAIEREVMAVRGKVGLIDASPFGKIEVQGPDAARLLDLTAAGLVGSLAAERIRHLLFLNDEGLVMAEAACIRLAASHFLLTTAPGAADALAGHLEQARQVRWPHLKAFILPVCEAWATVALSGPRARDVLARLAPDLYLGGRAFPNNAMADAAVAGMPARVARLGFTGEVTYELSVQRSRAMSLWKAALEAGASAGITPVGCAALDVLRMEKGVPVIGRDGDGTQTAEDLGLGTLVAMGKGAFIGREALAGGRPALLAANRPHLVGLLTEDPQVVIPEGAALVADRPATLPLPHPMEGIGWVTSAAYSPTLGRSIALALVRGGRQRLGTLVHAPLEDRIISGRLTDPVFYDPKGSRTNG